MPQRGDTLYAVHAFQNPDETETRLVVESVTFLEEGLAEGATAPTYLCRDKTGRRVRCSTTAYVPTEKEAWERELKQCQAAIPHNQKMVQESVERLVNLSVIIERMQNKIASL